MAFKVQSESPGEQRPVFERMCGDLCAEVIAKKGQKTVSNFAPNKYNHIYFESIKYHTIKATFQGKSTIF